MFRPFQRFAAVVLPLALFAATARAQQADAPEAADEEEVALVSASVSDLLAQGGNAPPAVPAAPPQDVAAAPNDPTAAQRNQARSARNQYVRLSRAPNMFGDSLSPTGQLGIMTGGNVDPNGVRKGQNFVTDLPLGNNGSAKIGENNKALPMDRVYFVYNGFQQAITTTTTNGPISTTNRLAVNRYMLGVEKTFLDGAASLDVRLPFVGGYRASDPGNYALSSGNLGNLSLTLKGLLYRDEQLALAAGAALALPTGSDLSGTVAGQAFTLRNNAVHLLPYAGFLSTPGDVNFFQGFVQLDFAANGNDLALGPLATKAGTFTQQNLLYLDFTAGHWLFRDLDSGRRLEGVALFGELHYTSTIGNAQRLNFTGNGFNGALGSLTNHLDFLNLTSGLHFQLGPLANLRVGAVVPLRTNPNRQFNSEVQVSFNRFF